MVSAKLRGEYTSQRLLPLRSLCEIKRSDKMKKDFDSCDKVGIVLFCHF